MPQRTKSLVPFPSKLKTAARKSLILAADWAVRNQVHDAWPNWNANKGRFPYHIRIDPRRRKAEPLTLSTCWKTSRAAQGLYSAYSVTGKEQYLQAADLACDYVCTLQVLEPGYVEWCGSFREDSPQGPHVALRDGMEAVQAFINAVLVDRSQRLLTRAILGADYILRNYHHSRFTTGIAFPFGGGSAIKADSFLFYAGALPLAQLASITGDKKYLSAGVTMMDYIIANHILENGALGIKGAVPVRSHHTSMPGKYRNVISNDDGVGVAMLAVYQATGKDKYLDAAVGMGDFWVNSGIEPSTLASYASVGLFLADVYRATRDKRYLPVIEHLMQKAIDMQCRDARDPLIYGCFIGEDMATHYDKRSKPTDWVDLRITSYSLIALGKIAAERDRQWGCAYSCFGW